MPSQSIMPMLYNAMVAAATNQKMNTFNTKEVIGLRLDEAKIKFPNYIFRVMAIDGKPKFGTQEIRTDRIEVHISNGVIVKAYIG